MKQNEGQMVNFVVFDASNNILRTGVCPACDLKIQASNRGESVMEGTANDATDCIEGCRVVKLKKPKPRKDLFQEVRARKKTKLDLALDKEPDIRRLLSTPPEEIEKLLDTKKIKNGDLKPLVVLLVKMVLHHEQALIDLEAFER